MSPFAYALKAARRTDPVAMPTARPDLTLESPYDRYETAWSRDPGGVRHRRRGRSRAERARACQSGAAHHAA